MIPTPFVTQIKDGLSGVYQATTSKPNMQPHSTSTKSKLEGYSGHMSKVPIYTKGESIPYLPPLQQHLWIFCHALIPIFLHQAWLSYTGHESLTRLAAFILYTVAYVVITKRQVNLFRRLRYRYGFLDGDEHGRDRIPKDCPGKGIGTAIKGAIWRIATVTGLSYERSRPPAAALGAWKWWLWLSLEIGLHSIVLDFWYYWYHRAMHEFAYLWQYHRRHHLAKHPVTVLAAYADHEQELFDIVLIPLTTYTTLRFLGLRLGFYEWWICQQYLVFGELSAHSGLRIHATMPTTLTWLLRLFDTELSTEDHDLHHRHGWRKSYNYGKQTRLWDRVFGTWRDRIESAEANIDYADQVHLPVL
ncbi:fatty acid hydroxylase superfamily protein [Aspergillus terreus]|uniref:Fatty acid hydroxylase superfamily protein n=1 Tax=Aspergillus terreus TaxID=33178 RepID=A0A5M3ZC97_ASPTE|nr:hypothetical protein ATETN484_0014024500 [Aspergillus terreus]GFF20911.1 fatty acid hydroxylase superfamily protein [Aspergillus terreus]